MENKYFEMTDHKLEKNAPAVDRGGDEVGELPGRLYTRLRNER